MFADNVKAAVEAILYSKAMIDLTNKEVVVMNLVFNWQTVIATEELMQTALRKSQQRSQFMKKYSHYLRQHLKEEKGHAQWLKEDLASEEIDVESMDTGAIAMHVVGVQYYMINHKHSVSLLGYMAVLEGFPTPMALVEELEALHGKALFRTMRLHAVEDVEHKHRLTEILNEVPMGLHDVVMRSAVQTAMYIKQFSEFLSLEG